MSPDTSQFLSIVLTPLVSLIGTVLVLWQFLKRFPLDRIAVTAEAGMDSATAEKVLAEAGGKWLENYERMFTLLSERDGQIHKLRTDLFDQAFEYEKKLRVMHGELERLSEQVRLLTPAATSI